MPPSDEIFAFVLMPFDHAFDDVYRIGIQEPADSLDIRAQRVGEQIYAEGILERIYRQIEVADLIVADVSGQNPNVFYEVGYAHAKEKLCILLTKDAADIPFDLKHRRHIIYRDIYDLRNLLTKDLEWAKSEITKVRKSRVRVSVASISGDLDMDKNYATAKVTFVIDLHNDSDVQPAQIEAIYFYSSDKWTLYQGDTRCPSTESDLPRFARRHFLTPPVNRLRRTNWAQLTFRTDRLMARRWAGEEVKDHYTLNGHAVLRLATDRGDFDYELKIDTVAQSFPF